MPIKLIQHRYEETPDAVPGVAPGSIRIVFADPPYDFGVKYADDPTGDRLGPGPYQKWCDSVAQTFFQQLCPGGVLFWLCPAAHMDFVPGMLGKWGRCLYRIVKEETFSQYNQRGLTQDYRLLFCYQKPGGDLVFNTDAIRIPSARLLQKTPDKRADPRGRVPGQVWKVRRLQGTSDDHVPWHPCQLPPELLRRIVLGWSNPGEAVLDGFAGSGNMGLVCQATGREAVLIDQSPTYIAKMKERLKV